MGRGPSKFLSLLLRHRPEVANLDMDRGGWVSIDQIVENTDDWLTHEVIIDAVENNSKQRFTIKDGRIRANQGHSIDVDLGLEPVTPPNILYHGTYPKVMPAIQREGLRKMKRHHVHMATDPTDAETVGRRSGSPVLLSVDAARMHADGYIFYVSANGVWLTDHVPPKYLEAIP